MKPYARREVRQCRAARRELISIILIILVLVTSILLTCELETAWPSFIIVIAFFVFAARHPAPPAPPARPHAPTARTIRGFLRFSRSP